MSTAKVPTHQLGRNGPQISALGFGAMGLSGMYNRLLGAYPSDFLGCMHARLNLGD